MKNRRTRKDPRADEVAVRHRPNPMTRKGDYDQYIIHGGDQELHSIAGGDQKSHRIAGGDQNSEGRICWEKATIALTFLKQKIATTPSLKHVDPDRPPVIVVYSSKWAVSAALLQKHEGVYWTITYSSRALKPNEVNYGMEEKEVLALLRMIDI